MKRIRITGSLLLVLLNIWLLNAQPKTQAELNSGGASATSAQINLEYSIGNVFQNSVVANNLVLSPTMAREATEVEPATLPEPIKEQLINSKAGIKAWPVPSDGEVNVVLEGVENGTEAQIFDQNGKLILSFEIQPNEPVKLDKLTSGFYFLKTGNKEIPTIRLMVR